MEFFNRDEAFGFQAGIDDHEVVIDADHLGGDHFTLAHLLFRERFFKERGKTFGFGKSSSVQVDVL